MIDQPSISSRSATRRQFAQLGLTTALSLLFAGSAFAAPLDPSADGQAEWAQNYDTAQNLAVQRSTTPLLSQQTYTATEAAIERYKQIQAQGGWGTVPGGPGLKLGTKGQPVVALRNRLIASGDLTSEAGTSPIFDSFVDAGLKRFQTRHGITASGVVTDETLTELNVPIDLRIRQLETNLVRLKAFTGNLGARYVAANIPAAAVETVENDVVQTHHIAGVGRIDRQSPVMNTKAIDINFNPYWTVPASIIRKDLIPKMQQDPNYLSDNHIRIFNSAGQEVQASQINWHSMDATNYRFREDTGVENSLGVVRININNPYGVYMHDTPTKGIFGDDDRFVSSGCMRVQDVRDYVAWLLKDNPGWGRDQIDEVIRSGQRVDVKLAQPVPVYWVYVTAWATPEGIVQFRKDIYKRDGFGDSIATDQAFTPGYKQPAVLPQDDQAQDE